MRGSEPATPRTESLRWVGHRGRTVVGSRRHPVRGTKSSGWVARALGSVDVSAAGPGQRRPMAAPAGHAPGQPQAPPEVDDTAGGTTRRNRRFGAKTSCAAREYRLRFRSSPQRFRDDSNFLRQTFRMK